MSESENPIGWYNPETGQWDLEQPTLPRFEDDKEIEN